MRKIILLTLLIFNLVPVIKKGGISILGPNAAAAQEQSGGGENGNGDDGGDDGGDGWGEGSGGNNGGGNQGAWNSDDDYMADQLSQLPAVTDEGHVLDPVTVTSFVHYVMYDVGLPDLSTIDLTHLSIYYNNFSYTPDPTPPIVTTNNQGMANHESLCGSYKWRDNGNAFVMNVTNLRSTFVSSGSGQVYYQTIGWNEACVTVAKYYLPSDQKNEAGADVYFNNQYGNAVQDVLNWANGQYGQPGDWQLQEELKKAIQNKLGSYLPVYANFESGPCNGTRVPTNTVKHCPK